MKADLSGILKLLEKSEGTSPATSSENFEGTERLPEFVYLIFDFNGISLAMLEDETLVDKGAILLALLQFEFYDHDEAFKDLCAKAQTEYDRLDSAASHIEDWYQANVKLLHSKFQLLESLRPFFPVDLVFRDNMVLIELEFRKELQEAINEQR